MDLSHSPLMSRFFAVALLLCLPLASPQTATAQTSAHLGVDLVSRYVWRGTDFADQASVQPSLAVTYGGLEVGTWASYSLGRTADGPGFAEIDAYVKATAGAVSFGVTDYYYPILNDDERSDLFNVADDYEGAHTLEAFIRVGPASVPVSAMVATVIYNATDVPTYVELGAAFAGAGLDWTAAAGAAFALSPPAGTTGSPFYGTSADAALIHLSLGASKSLPVTSTFALPVSAALIVNPHVQRSFLVVGVRL